MKHQHQSFAVQSAAAICVGLFALFSISAQEPGLPQCGITPPPPQGMDSRKSDAQKIETMRNFNHRNGKRMPIFNLQGLPPEETARLQKLAKESPEAFRQELLNIIKKKRDAEFQELLNLRKEYLTAADETAKENARKKLEETLRKQIQVHHNNTLRRIKVTEEQMKLMQERLNKFKEEYQRRVEETDRMVEQAMKDFTDPEKEPSRNPPPPPERRGPDGKILNPPFPAPPQALPEPPAK